MKLVAYVEKVNNPINERFVGTIVIVDSELTHDSQYELCYVEVENGRGGYSGKKTLLQNMQDIIGVKHSVSNIEIIGVL